MISVGGGDIDGRTETSCNGLWFIGNLAVNFPSCAVLVGTHVEVDILWSRWSYVYGYFEVQPAMRAKSGAFQGKRAFHNQPPHIQTTADLYSPRVVFILDSGFAMPCESAESGLVADSCDYYLSVIVARFGYVQNMYRGQ